jgi:hypothetical protein
MDNAEEFRLRRDGALKAWRREVERFGELMKSADGAPDAVEVQKKAIVEARKLYDSMNEEYLNFIESTRPPSPKAPERIAR